MHRAAAGPRRWLVEQRKIATQAVRWRRCSMSAGVNSWLMPDAADPVQEIAELRALLAEREAELAVARAELNRARLRIESTRPACPAAAHAIRALIGKTRHSDRAARADARGSGRERSSTHSADSTACPKSATARTASAGAAAAARSSPREEIVHDPGRSARAAAAPALPSSART